MNKRLALLDYTDSYNRSPIVCFWKFILFVSKMSIDVLNFTAIRIILMKSFNKIVIHDCFQRSSLNFLQPRAIPLGPFTLPKYEISNYSSCSIIYYFAMTFMYVPYRVSCDDAVQYYFSSQSNVTVQYTFTFLTIHRI